MKSEYKTFREAYEAYVNPEIIKYDWLCGFLSDSPKLYQKFREYYDPSLYSELVVEADQEIPFFMECTEEWLDVDERRATALAFLAAMEEAGDL